MPGADFADEGSNHPLVVEFFRQFVAGNELLEEGDDRPTKRIRNWTFKPRNLENQMLSRLDHHRNQTGSLKWSYPGPIELITNIARLNLTLTALKPSWKVFVRILQDYKHIKLYRINTQYYMTVLIPDDKKIEYA